METPDIVKAAIELRAYDTLAPMSDEQVALLAAVARREAFVADELIFQEASHGTDFLFVGTGQLEARRTTPFGDQKVAVLGDGDLCGELSLLDGKPRSTSVVGLSDGHLWRFDGERMARLVATDHAFEVSLLRMFCRSLAGKIRQANEVMTQIMAPGKTAARYGEGAKGERSEIDEETKRRILLEQGVSAEDLQTLGEYVEAQSFASGERLFVEGECGDTLYIVVEGQVRISQFLKTLCQILCRRIRNMNDQLVAYRTIAWFG